MAQPFSHGDYTYATDGVCIVRVAKIDGYPDAPDVVAQSLDHDPAMAFVPGDRMEVPLVVPDEFVMTACDCVAPICGPRIENCQQCGGTGKVMDHRPVEQITGFLLNQLFIAKIKDLPGLKVFLPPGVRENPEYHDMGYFEFSGGCGLVMSCGW